MPVNENSNKEAPNEDLLAAQARIKLLEKVLADVKIRIAYMGWPAESMWQTSQGKWVPDWRKECAWIEHALHGTPIDEAELASFVSTSANMIPDNPTELPIEFAKMVSQIPRPTRPRGG